MNKLFKNISLLILLLSPALSLSGPVLEKIKKRGVLHCGVSTGIAGFSFPDSQGKWQGIDTEVCRALAVALFGDKEKVKFFSLSSTQRFLSLQTQEVDLLSRVTTHNLTRDTTLGLNFAPVVYFDGQGIMVKTTDQIKSVKDLAGASICTQQGTTTESNLTNYFKAKNIQFKIVVFESNEEVLQGFLKGRCDAMTTDKSGLAAERSRLKNPEQYFILPEVISKEPLAPAVAHGDDQWFDLVKWTVYALIQAEELGIHSKNTQSFNQSKDPIIRKFLGLDAGNGKALGVSEDWVKKMITEVGNYAEIFERTVGPSSPLKLEREQNALYSAGGLMYSPPFL